MRRKGISPHCQVEGAHGMHFAPCAVVGEGFIFSDLCTGTPKAFVTKHPGKREEITDVEFVPSIGLVRFTYANHPHITDYAEPHKVSVAIRL